MDGFVSLCGGCELDLCVNKGVGMFSRLIFLNPKSLFHLPLVLTYPQVILKSPTIPHSHPPSLFLFLWLTAGICVFLVVNSLCLCTILFISPFKRLKSYKMLKICYYLKYYLHKIGHKTKCIFLKWLKKILFLSFNFEHKLHIMLLDVKKNL